MRSIDNTLKSFLPVHIGVNGTVAALLAGGFFALGIQSDVTAEASDMRRIGYLTLDPVAIHAPLAAAFRDGLRDRGYIEGQNVTIDWRYAANDASALPGLVSELIGLRVELLVADGTQAALAAKRATSTIPIVVPTSGDIVRAGLVASLARPGGNLTGLTLMSPGLMGKRLALLKEMAPRIRRVAVLVNPDNPACDFQYRQAQLAAPSLRLKLYSVALRSPADIDRVLPSLAGRVDAMLLTDDFVMDGNRTKIGTIAIRNRWPSICGYTMPDDRVCLMWYGPDLLHMFRQAAGYVAQILGGRKPDDLPVQQPAKLTLILNAKTASALGIKIPQSLRLSADDIIR